MKFTLDGFSQEKAIELGLDNVDLRLLRYFIDFKDSGAMVTEIIDNEPYWWVKYDSVSEALPILGLSKRTVMKRFLSMATKGVLRSYTKKIGGTFSYYAVGKRYIELINTRVCLQEQRGVLLEEQGVSLSRNTGMLQKEEQNINLLKDKSIKEIDIYIQIIDYLNEKTGSKYLAATKTNKNLIKARLNDGFTIDDFKLVIDKKVKDWKGSQFEQYLRPQTLFSSKFEGYLNQKGFSNSSLTDDKEKKLKFSNYEQRDTDYDSMEDDIFGWDD